VEAIISRSDQIHTTREELNLYRIQYEFLSVPNTPKYPGYLLHVQVFKTPHIVKASDGIPYIRRGAQKIPCKDTESLKRLELNKGVTSFETETVVTAGIDEVADSEVCRKFIATVVPSAIPHTWLKKQHLVHDNHPTVGGIVLFADEPQAILPKRCAIKIYRYKTQDADGSRETLAQQPITIEGCAYEQIYAAVKKTKELIEGIQKLGPTGFEDVIYPDETLHEIITNAVLHRDYSIADDVHVRIFDNRVEVESPGRLPGHVTVENILDERFARNGNIVRIINKFPNPPNKDVGEGLNTAFNAMKQLRLKTPEIQQKDNSVVVYIRHEPLASPESIIMDYLETNASINNGKVRELCHIREDWVARRILRDLAERGLIQKVPGTNTASTAYRKSQ
jgi:ATP-dependent DNA helicase RecG